MKLSALVVVLSSLNIQAQLTSTNYTISPVTVDGGGGPAASASYQIVASSIGGIYGVASSNNYQVSSGYVPQIPPETEIDLFDYDSWKTQYFSAEAPNQARGDDADQDGISNEDEFIALTDPTDRSSRFSIAIIADGAALDITFAPKADANLRQYRLFRDNTLTVFPTLVPGVPVTHVNGISGLFNNVPRFGAKEFFRIEISLADPPN